MGFRLRRPKLCQLLKIIKTRDMHLPLNTCVGTTAKRWAMFNQGIRKERLRPSQEHEEWRHHTALGMKRGIWSWWWCSQGFTTEKTEASASTPRQGRTSKAYFSYMDTEPGFQGPPHTSQSPAQSRAQTTILTHGKTEGTWKSPSANSSRVPSVSPGVTGHN